MGDKYKDHIFSEEEIQEIIRGFFEQNRELRIGNEEKKQMTQIIEDIYTHIMSIRSPLCQAVKEHYITRYHRIFQDNG